MEVCEVERCGGWWGEVIEGRLEGSGSMILSMLLCAGYTVCTTVYTTVCYCGLLCVTVSVTVCDCVCHRV